MKKKHVKRIALILAVVLILGSGGTAGVRYYQKNRAKSVEVIPISSVNGADWMRYFTESSTYGTVVSDVSQSVYVPQDRVINEVYVEQGDEVKIGDKLLSYDTTLLELDLELQQLEMEELEQEIESAKADLQKLKNTTPVEKTPEEEQEDFLGPNQELPDDADDGGEDEARMIPVERRMSASQDAGAEGETQAQTDAPQTNPPQTEPPQTEPPQTEPPQTEPPQTDAPQTDAPQTETQQTEPPQTNAPQMEPPQPQTSAPQGNSSQPADGYQQADDLPAQGNPSASETAADGAEKETDDTGETPKINQSLQKLLAYIRVKELSGQEETLLADTRDETEEEQAFVKLTENKLKLIPHFKETEKAHFERLNTYTMLIRGITLRKKIAGKLYGIARINGEDYPEIGGYTLEQDSKQDDVVHLTLAFHDGLDEQHAISAELEDMYAEITLSADELTGEDLIFRTGKKESDVTIAVEDPQKEGAVLPAENEDENSETGGKTGTETDGSGGTQQTDGTTENDGTQQTQTDGTTGSDGTQQTEAEIQSFDAQNASGSESVSDEFPADQLPGGESGQEAYQVKFDVTWYHGTNPESNWPDSLQIELFGQENAETPAQVYTVPSVPDRTPETGAETENPNGDDEPEPETEQETAASENGTETAAPETETSVEGQIEDVVAPEDHTLSTVHWEQAVEWSQNLGAPDAYSVNIPGILDYIQTKEWVRDETSGVYICRITMKYLEPQESPLVKLVPFTELTYETGASGKYYKGSGTKEDPFVFFCVDGATIRSSFVNWVLGFDEDGTARQTVVNADGTSSEMPLGTGYYVVLEIRESDTITGAFIRSVGLDGNVYMEYGYPPNVYWLFTSESGMVRYEEEIQEPTDIPGLPGGFPTDDPGWQDVGETYTAEELARAIKEKELEIRRLESNLKEGQLKLRQYEKDMAESVVVSSVDGYVESVGDTNSSSAYMVVTSQGGLYLRTTVSELDLDSVKRGDILSATSWESMNRFNASITDINYFPTQSDDNYYGGNTNPNSSSYPVLAHIEDASGLMPYEMVEVTFQRNTDTAGDIYLPVAYVRSENGQSYVYKAGADALLKKQYVRTGSTMNDYVEIKEGLTVDDAIAFPYGKQVKDGAKTVVSDGEDMYF